VDRIKLQFREKYRGGNAYGLNVETMRIPMMPPVCSDMIAPVAPG